MNKDQIRDLLCEYYGIHQDHFMSRKRIQEYVEVRQVFCYILKELGIRNKEIDAYFDRLPTFAHDNIKACRNRMYLPYFRKGVEDSITLIKQNT